MVEEQFTKMISDSVMEIKRPSWSKAAIVTVREDYIDEIKKYKWSISSGYPYNSNLGYLHAYVMSKWYGKEICDDMRKRKYVIDHIDNDHFNATITNLAFLSNMENVAKGQCFDKVNKDKMYIALSIFRDFNTKLFQVTMHFNYPAKIIHPDISEPATLYLAYLLYEDDYSVVIYDCHHILHEYYLKYTISPFYLRCIDYDMEGFFEEQGSKEAFDYYISGKHGHPVCLFYSRGYIEGWDRNKQIQRFYLHPNLKTQKTLQDSVDQGS